MTADSDRAGLFNLKASFPTKEEKEAFFTAARQNEIGALEKILKKFPDAAVAWRKDSGEAVIPAACNALRPKTLAFLLKAGANIDDKGPPETTVRTALQTAALRGDAPSLEVLLNAGASVDLPGKYGETPLMTAVEKDHYACADLLVLAGADPLANRDSYRQTALDKCKSQQMRDVIAAAQKRRADFLAGKEPEARPAFAPPPPPAAKDMAPLFALRTSFPTEEEEKAFFEAAKENELRALRKMLERFPDMAAKWRDGYGNAVLAAAGSKLKPDTVALLVAQGANIDDDGTSEKKTWPPLHTAARQGDAERVALLLSLGAKVDLPAKYGDTALVCAVENDKRACVDLLVLAGADPDFKAEPYRNSSALEKCKSDDMRDIIRGAQEKRAHFLAGLAPSEKPRFVPRPPVPDPSTVKILKRIDLRFKVI